MRETICVDLDGVLADYGRGWQGVDHIGDPIPGAVEFVKKLNGLGRVVIFTCRCNPQVSPQADLIERVAFWLDKHGFVYDEIYQGIGKPIASAYIDDRAVPCQPLPASKWKLLPAEANKGTWRLALERTRGLIIKEDSFVSDPGTTV